jgi:hypothetical protein
VEPLCEPAVASATAALIGTSYQIDDKEKSSIKKEIE